MQVNGEFRICAARRSVWDALHNPELLQQCLAGCEALERLSATEYHLTMRAGPGPLKARFSIRIELSAIDPLAGYTLSATGLGGAAGFATGEADVILLDDHGATILAYVARARFGGRLARAGLVLVTGTARKLTRGFFAAFIEQVEVQAREANRQCSK